MLKERLIQGKQSVTYGDKQFHSFMEGSQNSVYILAQRVEYRKYEKMSYLFLDLNFIKTNDFSVA